MDKSFDATTDSVVVPLAQRYRWPIVLAAVWFAAAVTGLYLLVQYANIPGTAGDPPKQWPSDTSMTLNSSGATLVMFVHPRCSCTRASLSELQRTVAHCAEPITSWIVFYRPTAMAPGWEQTDLWHTALGIRDAHVISDIDGVEARRFHAFTSGQTVLYDSKGELLFSGGITGERGHEGDNAGQTAIEELVNASTSACRQTPVFGCPITPASPSQ
jgi:hypothetical protein